MHPRHAAEVAEHTSLRAKERAAMAAKGANANTLYGFDLRSERLLKALVRVLSAEVLP